MSAYRELVLATRNEGKLREMQQLVAEEPALADVTVVSVASFPDVEDVVETGVTFLENSALKAHAVAQATGLPAIADDSGLSVEVLGGCPGVFSARWSGTHGADQANIDLLLAQTADVSAERLAAKFVCCVVLALPDGTERSRIGEVHGRISRNQRGDNGFGYDPIFELPDGRSMAELGAEEKNAISHRGTALRALRPDITELLGN
ncbi:RdgB/HAM1 family non-canonical purine NTP pyrophosphatase [Flexivirga oryzae]|uniref:dITP/XTP pyrophosphatase n=1 Tax=Flexivirga oryzae TaxID=1794944 RepID=A0A839MY48_9MICO|nr:XTP/dITP diphosphohydrolase [Flexivirga oryzae]